jgi:hypothetical protein
LVKQVSDRAELTKTLKSVTKEFGPSYKKMTLSPGSIYDLTHHTYDWRRRRIQTCGIK